MRDGAGFFGQRAPHLAVFAAAFASLGTSEDCDRVTRDDIVDVADEPVELRYRARSNGITRASMTVFAPSTESTVSVTLEGGISRLIDGAVTETSESTVELSAGEEEQTAELESCTGNACRLYDLTVTIRLVSGEPTELKLRMELENSDCRSDDSSLELTRLP